MPDDISMVNASGKSVESVYTQSLSFAGLATKLSDNAEPWILKLPPTKKLQPTRPVMKLRGSGASSQSVRGVPPKEILAAFVSRVALETTEEELATFLSDRACVA